MIKKILIANRGEIALRIIRAAKEMGITTVAVYSEADEDSLPVRLADEKYCIGPAKASESYLKYQNLLSVAVQSQADAIHPGYGFLSENPDFADACSSIGLNFIGPSSETISMMGDKAMARKKMIEAGVPVIPGSEGVLTSYEKAEEIVKETGFPVLIKAAFGGGGKGMRIVRAQSELKNNFLAAQNEAKTAFGDESVYMERFIENPSHIEIQILADKHGNVIHLGERDCSIQRKHQKLIEETPSPKINSSMRDQLGQAAIKAAKSCGYYSAGTVEFLMDKNKNFYFIEMNTRIQVEHPITEEITGLDLIKEQIKIANGDSLELKQEDIQFRGHAIECRINAEDPDRNFMPNPGKIQNLIFPGGKGIRVDSAVYNGYQIPPFYDSNIGKLIVHAPTRLEAIEKMKRALDEIHIDGVKTTIKLHKKILNNQDFVNGNFNTSFIEKHF